MVAVETALVPTTALLMLVPGAVPAVWDQPVAVVLPAETGRVVVGAATAEGNVSLL